VFGNRVLRRLDRFKRKEGWRKLRNEELHNFDPSAYVIRVIKLKRLRGMEELRYVCTILVGNPEG
jgi:hypothetical protein